jgi:hypothetical protein
MGSSQPSSWLVNSEATSRTISSRYFQRRAPRSTATFLRPAAEKTAEDEGEQQGDQGQQEDVKNGAGQQVDPEDERVKVKEKAGMRQVLDGGPGAPQQQEKEQSGEK